MSRLLAAALALTLAVPALANDSLGSAGTVDFVDVNAPTGTTYLQYHGRVFVTSPAGAAEYRWGGSSCSNKSLSDANVALLVRALESGLLVTPRFQAGQGSNRCLVGFTLRVP